MSQLFDPLTIRSETIRNRVMVSPMCQYSCTNGLANSWHATHLISRAVGGAGLVMTEAAAVVPEGRISYADLGIWSDEHSEALRAVAEGIREHGAVPAIQLAHAGRKASTQRPWDESGWNSVPGRTWEPVSSTETPFAPGSPKPRRLSEDGIAAVIRAFAEAAGRSVSAGFGAVEVHAAHGYLLHQFLSPLCNDRTDDYGGSFENRVRLLLEVVVEVREAVGDDVPILVRISATDWRDDGWTIDDSVRLAPMLKDAGADLIDCSSGGILPRVPIPHGPGYQVELAAAVRAAGVPSGAVGLITAAEQADQIVRTGQADAVLIGRAMLRNPYWAMHAAQKLGETIEPPNQYRRAW